MEYKGKKTSLYNCVKYTSDVITGQAVLQQVHICFILKSLLITQYQWLWNHHCETVTMSRRCVGLSSKFVIQCVCSENYNIKSDWNCLYAFFLNQLRFQNGLMCCQPNMKVFELWEGARISKIMNILYVVQKASKYLLARYVRNPLTHPQFLKNMHVVFHFVYVIQTFPDIGLLKIKPSVFFFVLLFHWLLVLRI